MEGGGGLFGDRFGTILFKKIPFRQNMKINFKILCSIRLPRGSFCFNLAGDGEGRGTSSGVLYLSLVYFLYDFTTFDISSYFLKIVNDYLFSIYYISIHYLFIDVTTSSPITG